MHVLNGGRSPRNAESPRRLSKREQDVLEHAELTRKDIALVLDISAETVKSHLGSAYRKLGVETRAAAVRAWEGRKAA